LSLFQTIRHCSIIYKLCHQRVVKTFNRISAFIEGLRKKNRSGYNLSYLVKRSGRTLIGALVGQFDLGGGWVVGRRAGGAVWPRRRLGGGEACRGLGVGGAVTVWPGQCVGGAGLAWAALQCFGVGYVVAAAGRVGSGLAWATLKGFDSALVCYSHHFTQYSMAIFTTITYYYELSHVFYLS
jgi:hypothetical protein